MLDKVQGYVEMELGLSVSKFETYIGDNIELTIEAHDSIYTNLKVWQATSISLKMQYITSINLKCERLKIEWSSRGKACIEVEVPIWKLKTSMKT